LDERYSDANFTVPSKAENRDGTIKPQIIRARWSVTLRSNSRNLEDQFIEIVPPTDNELGSQF
jgi:hypothetical protein